MSTILTNPVILATTILVVLCLLKVNVFLSIIIAALCCSLLGGATLVEGIEVFYSNMGNDNRMVLFLLLLGVLAATMQYNNVGEVLAPRVAKLVGKKVWLFPIVLTLFGILVETFVLIGVSFLLVIVPRCCGCSPTIRWTEGCWSSAPAAACRSATAASRWATALDLWALFRALWPTTGWM